MRGVRVWARLVGLPRTVVEDVEFGSEGEFVISVRPVVAGAGPLRDLSASQPGVRSR